MLLIQLLLRDLDALTASPVGAVGQGCPQGDAT